MTDREQNKRNALEKATQKALDALARVERLALAHRLTEEQGHQVGTAIEGATSRCLNALERASTQMGFKLS